MSSIYINAGNLIGLQEFLVDPKQIAEDCGMSSLLVLHDNKPAFYVLNIQSWSAICSQLNQGSVQGFELTEVNPTAIRLPAAHLTKPRPEPTVQRETDQRVFEKKNNFTALAETLLDAESERVSRNELSASSVGIQRNRLDAHVLPFFKYIPPPK